MPHFLGRIEPTPARSVLRFVLGAAVAALVISMAPKVQAQSDSFSDLEDTSNPTWTHLSGYVGSSGQTWDASSGAYRLTAVNNGLSGLGFVGSHVGASYTDVRVSADITSFVGPPAGAVFGVAARLNGNNALAALTGYAYAYEPFAASGQGEMVLYRIGPSVSANDIGSQQVTLDPLKDYRFVLEIIGPNLHGQVFEIVGGGLVAERFATDANYASGFSGVIAYSQNPVPPVDFTVDNFLAEASNQIHVTRLPNGQIQLSWEGPGHLEEASEVTGPWNDYSPGGDVSPVVVNPDTPQRFFRVHQ